MRREGILMRILAIVLGWRGRNERRLLQYYVTRGFISDRKIEYIEWLSGQLYFME